MALRIFPWFEAVFGRPQSPAGFPQKGRGQANRSTELPKGRFMASQALPWATGGRGLGQNPKLSPTKYPRKTLKAILIKLPYPWTLAILRGHPG